MARLSESVRYIKGIGEKRAALLNRLNIFTLYDLISYFPRDWQDRSGKKSIAELQAGDMVCVRGLIATDPRFGPGYGAKRSLRFRLADDSGYLSIIYFNNPYVAQKLHKGDEVTFFGKVELSRYGLQMANPDFENVGGIVPIYPLTAGISQKMLQRMIGAGLEACKEQLADVIPNDLRMKYGLCHARFAYENIHFPQDYTALAQARRRLVFEEFFVFSAALALLKERRNGKAGLRIPMAEVERFYQVLPFSPTGAQKNCIEDILKDMASGKTMNRLIQGDVGSGKTICAAAAVWAVCKAGKQAAFMVPTEILAQQHYQNLAPLMESLGIPTVLLIGSMTKKQKLEAAAQMESGQAKLAIGTHALLSEYVTFQELSLVITDEQHRFGVEQRAALAGKGNNPHTLFMSATPIPRTLALIMYGDLEVSIIDELPPGRQPVDTFVVDEGMRPRIQRFIRRQVEAGRQVYIVCPMVEESEAAESDLKAATACAQQLQKKVFPDLRIAFVHGRMKAAEKEQVMAAFQADECDILVATTVIEVGVDVANATLMVVENAERFGLSQLHQLRGRVGRGKEKSYCVLFNHLHNDPVSSQRLDVMRRTSNGFEIAEADLKFRGPGDFFGARQHGLPMLKIADFGCDLELMQQAQQAAASLLRDQKSLNGPEYAPLMDRIQTMFQKERFN